MALVGPLLKSFCVDNGQNGIAAEINGKTPADTGEARTPHGAPAGSQDNSAIASATSEGVGDAKKFGGMLL